MKFKQILGKSRSLNYFVIAVLLLLAFSLLYFLYFRQRSRANLYVEVTLTRPMNFPIVANVPYNWLPYWMVDALKIGDKEYNPLGGTNAEIVDKDSIETINYGKNASLLLKVSAIKDRSGTFLFKNKPLMVGSLLDLKFTQAQVNGLVTYVGPQKPSNQIKYLTLVVSDKAMEKGIANKLNIGDEIRDDRGDILVKIKNKKETRQGPVGVPMFDPALGRSTTTLESDRVNLELTIEARVKKIDDLYYFANTQKIKLGELIYLPFKDTSQYFQIISSENEKDKLE